MEGLLNYAYVQTNSLNLFDKLGHALGITLVAAPGAPGPCGYQTGPQLPAKGGGSTTNPADFSECAGILGDRQPGINYARQPSGLFGNLPRYDASVCPDGSDVPSICDPLIHTHAALSAQKTTPSQPSPAGPQPAQPQPQTPQQQKQQKQLDKLLDTVKKPGQATDNTVQKLKDLLNLPQLPQLPDLPQVLNPNANGSTSGGSPTDNLLNFLLGQ
jgi:hypothetical protein